MAKYQDDAVELRRKGERASGHWTDYVPLQYRDRVIGAFQGDAVPIRVTDEITVYRYWGGRSAASGPWLTTRADLPAEQARAWLALPDANTAKEVASFIVPKDTVILIGEAANQSSAEWAGPYAVGGGMQIYVPDPTVLIKKP